MVEAELAVTVAAKAGHGLPCCLVGLVRLLGVGAEEQRGGGGVCGGGGTNGDRAAAAAAAEAEVGHPAPTGFRQSGEGGGATIIIGFASGYGLGGGHWRLRALRLTCMKASSIKMCASVYILYTV